ncbi:MAG: AI-2E family transporter [Flavobacteriales bacterium]|nr:AI-2E family transporter [Flavobacteriales bacterium]
MKEGRNTRYGLIILGLIILIVLGWVFRTIIAYVIISIVIGFMGDPIVSRLKRIRMGRFRLPSWLCALITLSLFIGFVGGFFWILGPVIADEIEILMNMDTSQVSVLLDQKLASFSLWMDNLGLDFDAASLYKTAMISAQNTLSVDSVKSTLNEIFRIVSSILAGVFSVMFISFFFLKDVSLFHKMVFTLTPDKYIENAKNILIRSHKLLTRYFVGIFLQTVIMMVILGLGLYFLGVENAFIIAVFGGLVNVIPYLGPFVSIGFGLFVGLTSGLSINPEVSLAVLSVKILVVHLFAFGVDSFLVQPLILGESVKAHPLEIFIVILAAGTLGGIMGMVLALPLYSILRIVASEFFVQFKIVETLTRRIDQG